MRPRSPLVDVASIVGVTLALGWILSLATTRMKNWFVMTDELYYERLAVSVAQTGSLLPRLHGEVVSNVNQLYPILISAVFGEGDVARSLEAAHRLNAFLIASAAIPVFLLARRLALGTLLSLWVGALSVAVPWIVLSSFLLTENVAYPMFCWAVLALTYAVESKRWTTDLLALAGIGAAVLARTQFVVLVAVVLAAIAIGKGSRLLGSYSVTAENIRLDFGLVQLVFEHVAALALALAIVPFIVGCAWLIDRLRPSSAPRQRAFAVVGTTALVLVLVQVASFNQRFGAGLVK